MVLKRIFLILILPIFTYAQWTDPRPRSVQLWHMAEGVIDSLTVSAFYADTLEAKETTLSEDIGGLIRLNGFTSSSNYGAGLFLITNTSYTPDGANVIDLNSGSNQLVRLTDPIVSDTSVIKTLPPIYETVNLKQLSSSNTNGGGMFVYSDSVWDESYGIAAIGSYVDGKQWVRDDWKNLRVLTDVSIGITFGDSSSAVADKNRNLLQKAIDLCYFGSRGKVVLTGGFYVNKVAGSSPAYCIDPRTGVTIEGQASQPVAANGATIRMRNGQNATLLYAKTVQDADEWFHDGRLINFNLDPNGANNDTANGIYIYRMGERSRIQDIGIGPIKGYGIKSVSGTAHDHIENVTINPASSASWDLADKERIGLWLEAGGQRTIMSISGDNLMPALYAKGSVSAQVLGLKIEGIYTSSTNSAIIWADSADGNTAQLNIQNVKVDATNLHTFFHVEGVNFPNLSLSYAMLNGNDSLLVDRTTGGFGQGVNNFSTALVEYFGITGNSASVKYDLRNQDIGYTKRLRFYDHNGTLDGYIVYNTDQIFHLRSPSNQTNIESDDGVVVATFHETSGFVSNLLSVLTNGVRVGGSSASYPKVDSLKIQQNKLWFYVAGDSFMTIPADSVINFRN